MKHAMSGLPTDSQGRLVLGQARGGCPYCGAVAEYPSKDGRVVVRIVPSNCCGERKAQVASRGRATATSRPYRADLDG